MAAEGRRRSEARRSGALCSAQLRRHSVNLITVIRVGRVFSVCRVAAGAPRVSGDQRPPTEALFLCKHLIFGGNWQLLQALFKTA
ncbi:hypothetical protein L596_018972 [Steinernema carpocapsae]|uniref:Uncharacterized protein n=1 Tax=Steinernema carpocapsae TaxID=34508 RepID=A0A4U5N6Y3_STECR|nr:hypothetical protein L596_018972 [Steinernema carpocapsae]